MNAYAHKDTKNASDNIERFLKKFRGYMPYDSIKRISKEKSEIKNKFYYDFRDLVKEFLTGNFQSDKNIVNGFVAHDNYCRTIAVQEIAYFLSKRDIGFPTTEIRKIIEKYTCQKYAVEYLSSIIGDGKFFNELKGSIVVNLDEIRDFYLSQGTNIYELICCAVGAEVVGPDATAREANRYGSSSKVMPIRDIDITVVIEDLDQRKVEVPPQTLRTNYNHFGEVRRKAVPPKVIVLGI